MNRWNTTESTSRINASNFVVPTVTKIVLNVVMAVSVKPSIFSRLQKVFDELGTHPSDQSFLEDNAPHAVCQFVFIRQPELGCIHE